MLLSKPCPTQTPSYSSLPGSGANTALVGLSQRMSPTHSSLRVQDSPKPSLCRQEGIVPHENGLEMLLLARITCPLAVPVAASPQFKPLYS